jgi:hypothetical protein
MDVHTCFGRTPSAPLVFGQINMWTSVDVKVIISEGQNVNRR